MEQILIIVEIIALLCVAVLSIFLIMVILRVRDILAQIERDLKEISSKAIPVFENLEVITSRIKKVTSNIEEQVEIVGQTINSIRGIADNIVNFQQRVQEKVQEPILESLSILSSLVRGVRSFVERVRG